MRPSTIWLWLVTACALPAVSGVGCGDSSAGAGGQGGAGATGGGDPCEGKLFGQPNEKTGLDASQCAPACACGAVAFEAPAWPAERVANLLSYAQLEVPAGLASTPYAQPASPAPEGSVCAVLIEDLQAKTYRTETFASVDAALAAGGILTHFGGCGLCSSLADLAVYARELDLTAPVRQCGIDTFAQGFEANVSCLEQIGFTTPCAQIWAYNTQNTRAECLATCSALINAPYHEPSGQLNECLRCDEEKSGPVFKAVAGRTRRNTGVASALCRPCEEVKKIDHAYP